ncbi:MAG: low-specificity L-threonine aldolase [Deltaproteobacteria bacterium]|nr:low-specificity L-threonine aldolase [Deltaproteobacteria bacterium]
MAAPVFDLRSDTVTQPSPAMREAMAQAEVGDDVYREDPTVRRLEERVAQVLGKAAALFVPSGTMANQIALLYHCRPGDEVILGKAAHSVFYESGAPAAWSGALFEQVGEGGLFTAADVAAAIKPRAYYCPRTSLVMVENTHTHGGGRVFPQTDVEAIAELARREGLGFHLDGARLWNAAAAVGRPVAELCAPCDTVSVCFSKGLGAPVGSAFCGPSPAIEAALRFRKMLGGGMRQVGVLAAAALYALEHNQERITEDHEAAQRLAAALGELPGVTVAPVDTNIVHVNLEGDAARVAQCAEQRGVRIAAMGPGQLRMCTHLDVSGPGFDSCLANLVEAHREALGGG